MNIRINKHQIKDNLLSIDPERFGEYFYKIDSTVVAIVNREEGPGAPPRGNSNFRPANKFDLTNLDVYWKHDHSLIQRAPSQKYDFWMAMKLADKEETDANLKPRISIDEIEECLEYHFNDFIDKGGDPYSFIRHTKRNVLQKHKADVFGDVIETNTKTSGINEYSQEKIHKSSAHYEVAMEWIATKEEEYKKTANVAPDEIIAGLALSGRQANSILFYYLKKTKVIKGSASKIADAVKILTGHSWQNTREDLSETNMEAISSYENLEEVFNVLNSVAIKIKTEMNKKL